MATAEHLYAGLAVYFGTKHEKEKALQGPLGKLSLKCTVVSIDTDQFGTFSGEIERVGTIKDTLRKKIQAVFERIPEARLALASEGSFGPHPSIPFIGSDHEALLLTDRELGIEIYAEEVSMKTNQSEVEFGPRDDLEAFLEKVNYPSHAIIVQPKGNNKIVFKGLNTRHGLGQAIIDAFMASPEAKVILSSDMRACFNPTRMKVIEKAGDKLVEKLLSLCPQCQIPGFAITKGLGALPCSECGVSSHVPSHVLWGCVKCVFTEERARPDGKTEIEAKDCEQCNP